MKNFLWTSSFPTVMYRISFQWSYRKSILDTYTIFNWEHTGVTPVTICEFRRNRTFTEVIVRTDGLETNALKFHK